MFRGPLTYIKNFEQLLLLGRFLYPKQDLPEVGGGLVLLPDGDVDGVTNQPSSQLFCALRDGRRHKQGLPFFWDLLQHLQHLLLEAHLQHGVHLHNTTTKVETLGDYRFHSRHIFLLLAFCFFSLSLNKTIYFRLYIGTGLKLETFKS